VAEAKRDYYEVLGVPRDADAAAIKGAFRKLALEFHPDRNKDPGAEAKFKEIAEAYAVLYDPKKRAEYDARGAAGVAGMSAEDLFAGVDFEDILGGLGLDLGRFGFGGRLGGIGDLFGGLGRRRRRRGPEPGADIEVLLPVTLERVLAGGDEEVRVGRPEACGDCKGTGAKAGTAPAKCEACGGSGSLVASRQQGNMAIRQIATCPRCAGRGEVIADPCPRCEGSGRVAREEKLVVTVPEGVEEGTALRVPGRGEPSPTPGGPSGDLYVVVRSLPDARFEREGRNLWRVERVGIADAVLGADLEVATLDGKVTLAVPAGTQPGTVLRLRGKGLPAFGGGRRGDLLVRVEVEVPERVSAEERALYERLRALGRGEAKPERTRGAKGART
jgi:molecular chaperone DnaJ